LGAVSIERSPYHVRERRRALLVCHDHRVCGGANKSSAPRISMPQQPFHPSRGGGAQQDLGSEQRGVAAQQAREIRVSIRRARRLAAVHLPADARKKPLHLDHQRRQHLSELGNSLCDLHLHPFMYGIVIGIGMNTGSALGRIRTGALRPRDHEWQLRMQPSRCSGCRIRGNKQEERGAAGGERAMQEGTVSREMEREQERPS
jgi:hypothetical protein